MCELLGSEPVEEEIPIELDDLYDDVQEAFIVYNLLKDTWDSMAGVYLGKDFSGITDIMTIQEIDDPKTCFSILKLIDKHRSNSLNTKNTKPATKN